jgi:hypothetical protein
MISNAAGCCYHTYMLSNLRLVLSVDVQPGDQHNVKHGSAANFPPMRARACAREPGPRFPPADMVTTWSARRAIASDKARRVSFIGARVPSVGDG